MIHSSKFASSSFTTVTGQKLIRMGQPSVCIGVCAVLATSLLVSPAHAVDVDGVITVDNAYGFAFGDVNGITTTSY